MKPILEAKDIEFVVEGRSLPVLAKTNLSIFPEEFVVILGHNGSGKSSLVKILSGDKNPTSGMVLIQQKKLSDISDKDRAKEIITITQNPHDRLFLELTLEENIILWEERYQSSLRASANPTTSLPGAEGDVAISKGWKQWLYLLRLPRSQVLARNDDAALVSTLSGGEKQSFLLSLVLSHPPAILFLDEHTSALDPKAAVHIMDVTAKAASEHKITTIMVTHRLEDAVKYGNRLIIMNEGVVTHDIPKPKDLSIEEIKKMME